MGRHGAAFLGIPYATAPRFAPPGPVAGWDEVRNARQVGAAAPQPARVVAEFAHGPLPPTDEECLNLNIYTAGSEEARPVLVWLHGGGFVNGHAGSSLYDGRRLAASADAVVVTVNYRLGSLGWLCHPELAPTAGAPSGNWGLLDQVAALEWVRANIASFGGDPGRVTLAGQSAGALCAMDLLVAPRAAGLFARAILQSPPLGDLAQTLEVAVRWAEALSRRAGGTADLDVRLLRGLATDEVVALHETLLEEPQFRGTRGGALPTIEDGTLPRSPVEVPQASPTVDILIGSSAEEGTFFFKSPGRPAPASDRIPAIVGHLAGSERPMEVIERYRERAAMRRRPNDLLSILVDAATDMIVAEPAARWADARGQALASTGTRVYRYRVDHRGAGPVLGATHTVEVPLVFGTWKDGGPGERLGGQGSGTAAVARAMAEAWGRFLHDGNPGWKPLAGSGSRAELGVFGGKFPLSVEEAS